MQTRCPDGALSAKLGSQCSFHRLRVTHSRQARSGARSEARKAQEQALEHSSPDIRGNGSGASNGASNGSTKGLISSNNNGVVLDRKGGSLEERISSGEFSRTQGSFKEKASRPVRQALAKDPLGPGIISSYIAVCMMWPMHRSLELRGACRR